MYNEIEKNYNKLKVAITEFETDFVFFLSMCVK